MTVAMCAKCKKFISISNIPTGNPTAWENPEIFALYYGICNCEGSTFYCSDCLEQMGLQCPNCGKSLQIHGPSAIPYEIYRESKDDIRRIILAKFGEKQKDKKSDETFIHRDTPAKGYTRSEVSIFSPSFVVSFLSFCILLLFTIAVYFSPKAVGRFLSFGKLGIIFLTIVIMSSVGASSFIMKKSSEFGGKTGPGFKIAATILLCSPILVTLILVKSWFSMMISYALILWCCLFLLYGSSVSLYSVSRPKELLSKVFILFYFSMLIFSFTYFLSYGSENVLLQELYKTQSIKNFFSVLPIFKFEKMLIPALVGSTWFYIYIAVIILFGAILLRSFVFIMLAIFLLSIELINVCYPASKDIFVSILTSSPSVTIKEFLKFSYYKFGSVAPGLIMIGSLLGLMSLALLTKLYKPYISLLYYTNKLWAREIEIQETIELMKSGWILTPLFIFSLLFTIFFWIALRKLSNEIGGIPLWFLNDISLPSLKPMIIWKNILFNIFIGFLSAIAMGLFNPASDPKVIVFFKSKGVFIVSLICQHVIGLAIASIFIPAGVILVGGIFAVIFNIGALSVYPIHRYYVDKL